MGKGSPLSLKPQSLGSQGLCSFHEQKPNYILDLGRGGGQERRGAGEAMRTLVCEAGSPHGRTLCLRERDQLPPSIVKSRMFCWPRSSHPKPSSATQGQRQKNQLCLSPSRHPDPPLP